DPPFNKEENADYLYNVKYKDSTWATMLENRLRLARDLLNDTGSIFVRCDYNGNMYVRLLMNSIFGEENFRNEIVVKRGEVPKGEVNKLLTGIDYIQYFTKSENILFITPKSMRKERKWLPMHLPQERTKYQLQVREFFNRKLLPPKGRHWALTQEVIDKLIKEGRIRINEEKEYIDLQGNRIKGMPEILQEESVKLNSNWTDIPSYSVPSRFGFHTENSEILLKRVIESTSNENNIILDFFLGSGTTCAVAHKLKRKWLGVEMGEHFYSVVLPRMKKVLFYDRSGISKEKDVKEKYNENNAGGFFKYFEVEQYEDTLRKVKYEDFEAPDIFQADNANIYEQYIFLRDIKLLDSLEIDYQNNKVKVDLSKIYSKEKDNKEIDLAETISCLTGKWIKKIKENEVEFEGGEIINLEDIDYKLIKPLIWW
ncbi:MAG: site-specific DNA-methyltransferase, partial [Patescibacteria group bacterium]|nr:site-specific DNA-methyltransferase [Patescibacteria group bacterium]